MKKIAHRMRYVRVISWNNNTPKNKTAWAKIIRQMVRENQRYFQSIKSCLLKGFERIKKIVFPSTSLKRSWLPTNKTQIIQNISIIASQKSTMTFSHSPIVSFPSASENIINIQAKKSIRYKNLFLTISLNVFFAILNIQL